MPKFNQGYKRSPDLTPAQCKEIQLKDREGWRREDLAFEYGVSLTRIRKICQGYYTGKEEPK